jgi:hypothetical protein
VQALCGGVTPFRGFFALFFVLLEARDVLVGEEEAVAREGGGAEELEDGFCDGDGRVVHDCRSEVALRCSGCSEIVLGRLLYRIELCGVVCEGSLMSNSSLNGDERHRLA